MRINRKISFIVIFALICGLMPSYATAEDSADSSYATREFTVNEFIAAIGKDSITSKKADLSKYVDSTSIDPNYIDSMALAVGTGLIKGYKDKTLHPKDTIKRVEALTILSRSLKNLTVLDKNATFTDIPSWATKDITRLAQAGIIKGYGDGTFGADDLITKEQVDLLTDRIPTKLITDARLQDDFYTAVNSDYLKNTTLPEGITNTSQLETLNDTVTNQVSDLLEGYINDGKEYTFGTTEQKVHDFINDLNDMDERNQCGLKQIKPLIDKIDKATTLDSLIDTTASIASVTGESLLYSFYVSPDPFETDKYSLYLSSGNYILTKSEMSKSKSDVLIAYQNYMAKLFTLIGYNEKDANSSASAVFNMQVNLAKTSMDKTTASPKSLYKINSFDTVQSYFTDIDLEYYLECLGITRIPEDHIVVCDQNLIKKMAEYMNPRNLLLLKEYCKSILLMDLAPYLTDDFLNAYNTFNKVRFNKDEDITPLSIAMDTTQKYMGLQVGQLYTDRYFSSQAKNDVIKMAKNITKTYQSRIDDINWLSDRTKELAIDKLDFLKFRIGYPDSFSNYIDQTTIDGETGNAVSDIFSISARKLKVGIKNIGSYMTGKEWDVLPQTAQAFYDPLTNTLTVTAGMLQAPYYDINAPQEENLGGIGSIMAHEIVHAFDAIGSQYDKSGYEEEWWQKADSKEYNLRCNPLITQFNQVQVYPKKYLDGKKTLTENIADLAAMACILDIIGENNPNAHLLFENYARIHASVKTNKSLLDDIKTDLFAPDKYRVNTILSNFQEFYDCYDIKSTDQMYISNINRVTIW